jgi:ribulose-phosphate 3-epimerase
MSTATVTGPALDHLIKGGPRLTVGMITADLAHLAEEVGVLESVGVELVHIDVMDGVFCPMFTVGPPIVRAVRSPILKDVHLMIDDPLAKIEAFIAAGADLITFHVEGAPQPHRVLRVLASAVNVNDPARGIVRGVALNPSTAVEAVEPLLDELELVLVLAVDPGWGGQTFISSTERRLDRVRSMIEASGRPILLGVDGGVTQENVARIAALDVDLVVSGSAIFDGRAAAANASTMLDLVRTARPALATA